LIFSKHNARNLVFLVKEKVSKKEPLHPFYNDSVMYVSSSSSLSLSFFSKKIENSNTVYLFPTYLLMFDFHSTFGVQNQLLNTTIISCFAYFFLLVIIQRSSLLYHIICFIHHVLIYTYIFGYMNR
jgi:hypothetical protein